MITNKRRKILITGGAGYIGSVLVGNLLKKGNEIRVLDRFIFGDESLLSYKKNKNLEIIKGDIRDIKLLKKSLEEITDVIHLAALVGEPACRENPKVTRQINYEATKMLGLLAKSTRVNRLIFVSTCSNYGISSSNEEATEESKLNPLSLYAKTKIASEKFTLSIKDKNFHPTVLRLATIFGLSPKMRFNLMVNEFAREVVFGNRISVRNKKAWRPFVHIQDASNAILTIFNASLSKVDGQIFNIVGQNIQKKQLINLVKNYNPNIQILIEEGGSDDKRDYRVSAEKIKKILGWRAKITLEKGFSEIVSALKKGKFKDPHGFKYNAWFDKKVFSDHYQLP